MVAEDVEGPVANKEATRRRTSYGSSLGWLDRALERFVDAFAGTMVRWPVAVLASCYVVVLLSVGALIGIGWSTTPNSSYDWNLQWDKFTIRRDMVADASDRADQIAVPERSDETFQFYFAYDAEPAHFRNTCEGPLGVFSPRTVQVICEHERELLNMRTYQESYCVLDHEGGEAPSCRAPATSLSYVFYGDEVNDAVAVAPCGLLEEGAVAATWAAMQAAPALYDFLVDKDAFRRGWPCAARSIVSVGSPLAGNRDVADFGQGSQFDDVQRDISAKLEHAMKEKYNLKNGFMRSRYLREGKTRSGESGKRVDAMFWSENIQFLEWGRMFASDTNIAAFSAVFVFIWLVVHTGSLFLGSMALIQILCSLPLATFLYRCVLQIEFFQTLQALVIFIVLGIGADDIFVYSDAWNQALTAVGGDDEAYLKARIKFAYSRALTAIFNTSFTTIVAFCATTVNRVMPIVTFGAYAACAVLTNYLLAISMTPAFFVVRQRYFPPRGGTTTTTKGGETTSWCCRCRLGFGLCPTRRTSKSKEGAADDDDAGIFAPVDDAAAAVATPLAEEASMTGSSSSKGASRVIDWYLALMRWSPFKEAEEDDDEEKDDPLWSKAGLTSSLKKKPVAWVCVLALAALGVTSAWSASRLEPPNKPEEWYQKKHMFQRLQNLGTQKFSSEDEAYYPSVYYVWGMRKLRRPDFDEFKPNKNRGDVAFSSQLIDLADAAQCRELFEACALARTWVCSECERAKSIEDNDEGLPLLLPSDDEASSSSKKTLHRPGSVVCFIDEFDAWLRATLNETVFDSPALVEARLKIFREATVPASDLYPSWSDIIGVVDGVLRFVVIEAKLSMNWEDGSSVQRSILRRANKLKAAMRAATPSLPDDLFQTAGIWIWYKLNVALVQGMVLGMLITFPIAAAALIGSTKNILLSLYAIVTIGFIVANVLGLAYYLGWMLGVKESIAAVIVIGLSVDYTLHLGHMYEHARIAGIHARDAKFHSAIKTMGVTVLSGAITTAGSGSLMYACQSTFFIQMATLIVATIVLSLTYSLFFFMPLLYIAGPEHDCGNIDVIFRSMHCKNKCSKAETHLIDDGGGGDGDDDDDDSDGKKNVESKAAATP